MGTGVMIGAGVFALMGQVAGAAGPLFPLAFVAAALVSATAAYSYVTLSNTYPSAGGIGKFLTEAYGVVSISGTFTMAMWGEEMASSEAPRVAVTVMRVYTEAGWRVMSKC